MYLLYADLRGTLLDLYAVGLAACCERGLNEERQSRMMSVSPLSLPTQPASGWALMKSPFTLGI